MGFSLLSSLGSCIFLGNYHERNVKFQNLSESKRKTASFKLSKFTHHSGRLLSSKFELIEFDERTSPHEVNPNQVPFNDYSLFIIEFIYLLFGKK